MAWQPVGVLLPESGDSAEEVITPSGKRVFSKESVQLMVEILGVDPNRVVTEDELAQMFMPSADYIQSIIGDQKNVVFAALDPRCERSRRWRCRHSAEYSHGVWQYPLVTHYDDGRCSGCNR